MSMGAALEALDNPMVEPALPGSLATGDWFVLHTMSRQEKAVAEDLRARGTSFYLPLVRSVRYYGRRKTSVEIPLFPGYLFLKGAVEEAYAADRTRRVAQILRVPDQDRIFQDLESIHRVICAGGELEPHPYLRVGTRVEVTAGPFRGTVGLINELGRNNRLILQIQAMGQASSLEIDAGLLSPVDEGPIEAVA